MHTTVRAHLACLLLALVPLGVRAQTIQEQVDAALARLRVAGEPGAVWRR